MSSKVDKNCQMMETFFVINNFPLAKIVKKMYILKTNQFCKRFEQMVELN